MTSRLGVAIPCYNEAESLPELIQRLTCPKLQAINFLIVDNGSNDKTSAILNKTKFPPNIRWLRVPVNKGYGYGILAGLSQLETDYLGWMHADLQTDPTDLVLFLDFLDSRVEYLKGKRVGRPKFDRFFTAGMSILLSIMFGRFLRDINGQPTIVSRSMYDGWKRPPHDFGLDLFTYIYAVRSKSRIVRIDVKFGRRIHGTSTWNKNFRSRIQFIGKTLELALRLKFSRHD